MTTFRRKDGRFVKSDDSHIVPLCNTHEDWFQHSEWVAELWCTITMLPLGVVGAWCLTGDHWLGGLLALHATLASALSHAIPYRWLLQWDKVAANALALWALTLFQWRLWPWYAAPLAIGALDMATRRAGHPVRGLHPIWHCAGPFSLFFILLQQ